MVPTRNLLHHEDKSNGRYYSPQYCIAGELESSAARKDRRPPRFPRLIMADEQQQQQEGGGADEAAGASTRGGGGVDGKDWLQLGLATASSSSTSSSGDNNSTAPAPTPMELELFADRQARPRAPLLPLPIRSYQYGTHRYGPSTASGSTSAPFLPFVQPLRSFGDAVRVISPPRRMDAGVWLALQAAPNQVREPILPQIPKSYLRIKDSNMKVEALMKYLADKLGLGESQVELTCRGHLLPPFLLVKYVRDSIWCSALREEALVVEATTDHVMTLLYSTSRHH